MEVAGVMFFKNLTSLDTMMLTVKTLCVEWGCGEPKRYRS
jgi:hypothetical protein